MQLKSDGKIGERGSLLGDQGRIDEQGGNLEPKL
jgi:hypothetical protein